MKKALEEIIKFNIRIYLFNTFRNNLIYYISKFHEIDSDYINSNNNVKKNDCLYIEFEYLIIDLKIDIF